MYLKMMPFPTEKHFSILQVGDLDLRLWVSGRTPNKSVSQSGTQPVSPISHLM